MKKINKKKQIPAYAFGIDQVKAIADIGQVVGAGMQSFTGNSAMPGYEAEMSGGQIAGSAVSGLASGAAAGSVAGPIGAGIGAAIGGIGSLIGAKSKQRAIEKRNNKRRTLRATEVGLNQQAGLMDEYYDENNMAYTFANGGMIPTNLAYVDNDEVLRDANGNLAMIDNYKPGTDNHLINTNGLESALSPNLKRGRGKETFAEAGEKIMKHYKPSKGNDKFAENTNKLNKQAANEAYDALLLEQEELKMKRGIKPKTKEMIPAYQDGILGYNRIMRGSKRNYDTNKLAEIQAEIAQNYIKDPSTMGTYSPRTRENPTTTSQRFTSNQMIGSRGANTLPHTIWNTPKDVWGRTTATPQYNGINDSTPMGRLSWLNTGNYQPLNFGNWEVDLTNYGNRGTGAPAQKTQTSVTAPKINAMEHVAKKLSTEQLGKDYIKPNYDLTYNGPRPEVTGSVPNEKEGFNWSGLSSLAPTLYNWIQGMQTPEQEVPQINPYSGTIQRTMANRRMNINPMIEANRTSRSISNYNAANLNANTGSNLAFRTQVAAEEMRNNANIFAAKQNADNQYKGEYADMLNNLGQQYMASNQYTNDINAANRAAARNYTGTAASQFGQWSQVQQQMNNQMNRDAMIYPLLESFLSQGYTQEQLEAIRKRIKLNRRGQ